MRLKYSKNQIFNPEWQRLVRAVRLMLTIALGISIGKFFHLEHFVWILITVVVVLFDQVTVGGTLKRSLLRLNATLCGAAVGVLTYIIFDNNPIINVVVTIIATFIFAFLFMDKKYSYVGILGLITLYMILMGTDPFDTSVYRVFSIILGIVISVITTLVFFPMSAKAKYLKLLIASTHNIATILELLSYEQTPLATLQSEFIKIENNLVTEIAKFLQQIEDSNYERRVKKIMDAEGMLLCVRRIYRLLIVIFQTESHIHIKEFKYQQLQLSQLKVYYEHIYKYLIGEINQINDLDGLILLYRENKISQLNKHSFTEVLIDQLYKETIQIMRRVPRISRRP